MKNLKNTNSFISALRAARELNRYFSAVGFETERVFPLARDIRENPGNWIDFLDDSSADDTRSPRVYIMNRKTRLLLSRFWTVNHQIAYLEGMIAAFDGNPIVYDPSTHVPGLGYWTPEDVELWKHELIDLRLEVVKERWARRERFLSLLPAFIRNPLVTRFELRDWDYTYQEI